jgi:hypothetical protein
LLGSFPLQIERQVPPLASGYAVIEGGSPYTSLFLFAFFDAVQARRGCEASLTEVARKLALVHWNSLDFVFLPHDQILKLV